MIRALLLILALAAAGAAIWLYAQRPVTEPDQQTEIVPEAMPEPVVPMITILAANRDLLAGETVTRDSLAWIDWPEEFALYSFVTEDSLPGGLETFVGWQTTEVWQQGEPVVRSALREPGNSPISETLAPGMRAIAVRVTIEATAGGFVVPGDRVDVIHTRMPATEEQTISRVIASNVRVIALDQTTERKEEQVVIAERTATLELDREQVENVTAAEQTGSLSLALRSVLDQMEDPLPSPPDIRIRRGGE
ncbi:Flp pilus assembly protein CpaB [Roseibaca sp. Y0-43]|uniref:Flp pilus assembly protein CpaB n=1 Tax=Roseibaca sp. Y0-43 TaxID=2816854 RepID=UPI001D0C37E8|nr:Flp pilus assembly protein CpaB [Roseibaca sp. Y0-43]MCC1482894.1 Flp pilus assembly protein CpaB [Roseibaca sp. Y0-43]